MKCTYENGLTGFCDTIEEALDLVEDMTVYILKLERLVAFLQAEDRTDPVNLMLDNDHPSNKGICMPYMDFTHYRPYQMYMVYRNGGTDPLTSYEHIGEMWELTTGVHPLVEDLPF